MAMLSSNTQPSNAFEPIEVKPEFKVTEEREAQSLNATSPIVFTEEGIVTLSIDAPVKAFALISVTEEGMGRFTTASPFINRLCAVASGLLPLNVTEHHFSRSEIYTACKASQKLNA